ncbi:MAG: hypothetical protein ACREJR_08195 [Candidatus Rokuibacteriota bacterium]
MRAAARGTSTVARHLLDRREEKDTEDGTLVVLEELAKTLERVLDRVDELRKQERAAAA